MYTFSLLFSGIWGGGGEGRDRGSYGTLWDKPIASLCALACCHKWILACTFDLFDRRDGRVVRASASRSGGRGFDPRPGHTKDFKIGTYCLLVRCLAFKNGERKLNTCSWVISSGWDTVV